MKQPELGKKIADLRKAKSLTQDELVKMCNLSVRTLQRIESGEVTPRSYTIKSIFDALGYNMHEISASAATDSYTSGMILSNRLEQLYKYLLELLNLKTNTMKKLSILSVLIIGTVLFLSSLSTNAQSKAKFKESLLGTWQKCDSTGTVATKGTVRFKVITPETFVVLEINKDSRNFTGDFVGTYTVEKNGEYTESINYTMSCYSGFQNVKNTFKVEYKNDLMYMTGTNNGYKEIWKKVAN